MKDETSSKKTPKPWISFDEQLQLLKSRGMQVDDDDAARDYLERIGYYRLSGYWYPMRRIDHAESQRQNTPIRADDFVPGSRFEDAVRLYVFDKKLRLLALDALERIEMAVRVDVAYTLGKRNPLAHELPEHLHGEFTKKRNIRGKNKGRTDYEVWRDKYRRQVRLARKNPFVEHHEKTYGCLPIWAAIEVWDFGMLSRMYSGMKHADRTSIAKTYGIDTSQTFSQWLRSLNFIRNVAAHHSRLWNINVLELSNVPQDWPPDLNKARPFFYFCLMQRLLQVICPNSGWGKRFQELLSTGFPNTGTPTISLQDFGTFPGWQTAAPWTKTESTNENRRVHSESEEAPVISEPMVGLPSSSVKVSLSPPMEFADERTPPSLGAAGSSTRTGPSTDGGEE
ncbi:MAG: Abi family protein [Lautropia sp.]|nr:Abi family protein [Lautropia sp.]